MAPPHLEIEIEAWLAAFRATTLAALPPAAFSDYREAVAKSYEQPPKTLMQARPPAAPTVPNAPARPPRP
eukprot:7026249-Prymnesium_polylepis.1